MAGSSLSITFILNQAAASAFPLTMAPPTTNLPNLFSANTFFNSTLKNHFNNTNFNYSTTNNISKMISNVNELDIGVQQQNGTIDELSLSELSWFSESNFSANYSESEADLLSESWWNVFDEKYLRHSMAWTITLIVAYMLILVVGVIGNFMVILVVLLRRQMRSVTNMFIMNLAVADLFVIVFCVPATLMSNIFTPWILGSFMCKGVAYVQGVSVCASAYSLVAVSLDRCKAIFRPFDRPSGLSRSQALITTCIIWIMALTLTIPWAVVFNVISANRSSLSSCVETWENEHNGKLYFLIANFLLCYCSPLLLISISNLAIWHHVNRRQVPQDSASAGPIIKMHKKARHGVLKMLGVVTLTFLISWLPLYIIVMRMKFGENISDYEYNLLDFLMPFAQWLGSWNSCINPILYAFLNNKFREMFKSLLPTWLPCVSRNNMAMMTTSRGATFIPTNCVLRSNNGTTSCTSVRISGNSGRSSSNSRSFCRHNSQFSNCSSRSLLVNNFREMERSSSRPTATSTKSTVLVGVTNGTCIRNTVVRTGTGTITEL